ncbi:BAG family molecular chaperone regulator 1 [Heracleum sosnowskyi]|uniref:BAG family molecular chaperone regulator 1 n=1 Tax=Heracleum sosnowskyi TaxID=360622 RepID=A0AAD8MI85_9APIA|nr:BAG family molecular chaperone regulator 1 [Heracleum sosnowskyi]
MMTMRSKSTGMFFAEKATQAAGLPEAWEVRPGGMLVQTRNSDSDHTSIPVPNIKVKVKYGSSYLEFSISSQASFGDLKKLVAGPTKVQHEDQKLIYKGKERDSRSFLDVSGVKNGSKIVLVEDLVSKENRLIEMRRSAKFDKASKEIAEITLEVDKFANQVSNLESQIFGGKRVVEKVLLNLIEQLMSLLIRLDGIVADGDVKSRRRLQVKRVQKYIETLDMLKIRNSMINNVEQIIPGEKHPKSVVNGQRSKIPTQNHQEQQEIHVSPKSTLEGVIMQQPVVVTTNWETFDSGFSTNPQFIRSGTAIGHNQHTGSSKQSWEYFL